MFARIITWVAGYGVKRLGLQVLYGVLATMLFSFGYKAYSYVDHLQKDNSAMKTSLDTYKEKVNTLSSENAKLIKTNEHNKTVIRTAHLNESQLAKENNDMQQQLVLLQVNPKDELSTVDYMKHLPRTTYFIGKLLANDRYMQHTKGDKDEINKMYNGIAFRDLIDLSYDGLRYQSGNTRSDYKNNTTSSTTPKRINLLQGSTGTTHRFVGPKCVALVKRLSAHGYGLQRKDTFTQ